MTDRTKAFINSITSLVEAGAIPTLAFVVLLAAGFFSLVISGTVQERNIEILRPIDNYRAENGADVACLFTGALQAEGIRDYAELFD